MKLNLIRTSIFVLPLTINILPLVTFAETISEDNSFLISSEELFLHSKPQDYESFALPLAMNEFNLEEDKASFSNPIELTNNANNYSLEIKEALITEQNTDYVYEIKTSTVDSEVIAANPKLEVNKSFSGSELASCQISPENSDDMKTMEVVSPVHLASNKENLPISPKSSDNSLESSPKQITNLKPVSCQASDLISSEPNVAIKLQTFNSQINQDQLALVPESNDSQLTKFSTTSNYNFNQFNKFDQTLALLSEKQFENLTPNSLDSISIGILNSRDSQQVKELLDVQLAQTEESEQPQTVGGEDTFSDASAAARKSSNPLGGDFMILLNQIDNYFLQGDAIDGSSTLNTWSLQPVVSIPMTSIGENWIWVTRPTFPFIFNTSIADKDKITDIDTSKIGLQPSGTPTFPPSNLPGGIPLKSVGGFGDIVVFSLLGQSISTEQWGGGDLVWGLGPTFSFPTASRGELGSGKWSVGPSAVGAFIGRKFILGGLMQNWFSFAGDSKRDNVSFSWLNLFYFLNFNDGWQLGGTPIITADWNADSGDKWTVPIGLGVYKTQVFDIGKGGKMPIKFGLEFQYMVVRPDTVGQEWNIRVTFAPVLPSPFASK